MNECVAGTHQGNSERTDWNGQNLRREIKSWDYQVPGECLRGGVAGRRFRSGFSAFTLRVGPSSLQ